MTALRCRYLTLTANQRFVTEDCMSCGDVFAMSEQNYLKRNKDKKSFYCPSCGNRMHYTGSTETDQLRQQLEAARSLAERESSRRRQAEAERAAARGEVQRIRTRVGNGVCPCCHRTFEDLGEHMIGQHPEWRTEDNEPNPALTIDRLSPNQHHHIERIGRLIDQSGYPGLPVDWGHASTIRALEARGVITIEGRIHEDWADEGPLDVAVPTLTGLRLIAAAGSDG